jgi:hypothetical protein
MSTPSKAFHKQQESAFHRRPIRRWGVCSCVIFQTRSSEPVAEGIGKIAPPT